MDLPKADETKDANGADSGKGQSTTLSGDQVQLLVRWLERTLSAQVSKVKVSTRLVSSPAIITEHESGAVRRMMQMVGDPSLNMARKHKLEINPNHPIMKGLAALRSSQPERAAVIAEQVCFEQSIDVAYRLRFL